MTTEDDGFDGGFDAAWVRFVEAVEAARLQLEAVFSARQSRELSEAFQGDFAVCAGVPSVGVDLSMARRLGVSLDVVERVAGAAMTASPPNEGWRPWKDPKP